jgi:hypothetical protein
MSYRADKPFGRRRTDTPSPDEDLRKFQQIRRDVDEDATGLIRRYLRLSEKLLGMKDQPGETAGIQPRHPHKMDRAA